MTKAIKAVKIDRSKHPQEIVQYLLQVQHIMSRNKKTDVQQAQRISFQLLKAKLYRIPPAKSRWRKVAD